MFPRPIILSAFLLLFLPASTPCETISPLPPEASVYNLFISSLWDLDMEISGEGAANQVFHQHFSSIVSRFENGACPPDYEALLNELSDLSRVILASNNNLADIEKNIQITSKNLKYAEKRNLKKKIEKIQAELDILNRKKGNIESSLPLLNQAYFDKFSSILATRMAEKCPEGMILLEGTFCIDKYEYPNRKGVKPATGVSYSKAAELCRAAGKKLCTGNQWLRACGGPDCRPNFKALIPFNPLECNSALNSFPDTPPAPAGASPVCDTTEGVADIFGNTWEWTDQTYSGKYKVIHGGAHSKDKAANCSQKAWAEPQSSKSYFGFRCCAEPAAPAPDSENPAGAATDTAAVPSATGTTNL